MTIQEPAPAPSSAAGSPIPPSIDERLESLRLSVCTGRPRSWAMRLKDIRDEAAKSGFLWEPRHKAVVEAIVRRGLLNDLETVETAPDARVAARRLKELDAHAKLCHAALFSRRVAELKRQNRFDMAGLDLEEGRSHALETLQDVGDWKWGDAYARGGETVRQAAQSGEHLLYGAAMTFGIFE